MPIPTYGTERSALSWHIVVIQLEVIEGDALKRAFYAILARTYDA
jgi:hypothetical protein